MCRIIIYKWGNTRKTHCSRQRLTWLASFRPLEGSFLVLARRPVKTEWLLAWQRAKTNCLAWEIQSLYIEDYRSIYKHLQILHRARFITFHLHHFAPWKAASIHYHLFQKDGRPVTPFSQTLSSQAKALSPAFAWRAASLRSLSFQAPVQGPAQTVHTLCRGKSVVYNDNGIWMIYDNRIWWIWPCSAAMQGWLTCPSVTAWKSLM